MLTDFVQAVYAERYGSTDENPIDAADFRLPEGYFALAYIDEEPAAMGGWHRLDGQPDSEAVAEIRRMFVRPEFQRRGLARQVLAHLEGSARANGLRRLVLETGFVLPGAIDLYRSSGYDDIPAFGYYTGEGSVHLGKRLSPGPGLTKKST